MADRDETVAGRWGWPALACVAGMALQLQQPALWPTAVNLGLAAAGAVIAFAGRRHAAWLALGAALLAFGSTAWRADLRLQQRLAPALEGQDLVLTGLVAQLPRVAITGQRFVFEVESATRGGQPVEVPSRVSLGWYRGWDGDGWLAGPSGELRAGQRWQLPARLKQPHGTLNPHGFDFELWLFEQGNRRQRLACAPARASLADQRRRTGGTLAPGAARPHRGRACPPIRWPAGVLAALALGDQAAIDHGRLGPVPRHRCGAPDEHQRPARDHVRLAGRRAGRPCCGGAARA